MDTTKFVTKIYLIENKEIVTKLRNPQLVFSYMAELLLLFFLRQSLTTNLVVDLELMTTTSYNIFRITTYYGNLNVRLKVFYVLNTYVKFCVNWIIFTI